MGVDPIILDLTCHLKSTLPEISFFFAVAPPSERFFEKRRSEYLFAMVDLVGVEKVSERLEHFFFLVFHGSLSQTLGGVASTGRGGDT